MSCFLVPAAEAIAMTAVKHSVKKKEAQAALTEGSHVSISSEPETAIVDESENISWSRKLGWLTNMLWGGAFLLLIEHIWHGEIVPWAPFITAMSSSSDTMAMLHEMSTVGVTMAILVTAAWFGMTLVADRIHRKNHIMITAAERN